MRKNRSVVSNNRSVMSNNRSVVDNRSGHRHGSVLGVGGHHSIAGYLGEFVLNFFTFNLGDSVTVFHFDGNIYDVRVVHTVLSGDLTASMLHCFSNRVSNCMSDRNHRSHWSNMSYRSGSICSMMAVRWDMVTVRYNLMAKGTS